jgi:hypothetical protein
VETYDGARAFQRRFAERTQLLPNEPKLAKRTQFASRDAKIQRILPNELGRVSDDLKKRTHSDSFSERPVAATLAMIVERRAKSQAGVSL